MKKSNMGKVDGRKESKDKKKEGSRRMKLSKGMKEKISEKREEEEKWGRKEMKEKRSEEKGIRRKVCQ